MNNQIIVSIHALLAECDQRGGRLKWSQRSFNPRTPCGVRPSSRVAYLSSIKFQSTHSLRSATQMLSSSNAIRAVSIHALLAECDNNKRNTKLKNERFQSTHSLRSATGKDVCPMCWRPRFNPRTPCGVRHFYEGANRFAYVVSIHALLAECDA